MSKKVTPEKITKTVKTSLCARETNRGKFKLNFF